MATQTIETAPDRGSADVAVAGTPAQVVGLVLLGLAPLTMFTIAVSTGTDSVEALPFLVIGIVLLAAAWLVARFGTWAAMVGVVLTVAAALAGFWVAFGLAAIASPADFVPATMFVLGMALSLAGGIRAIRRRRPPTVTATARGGSRLRVMAIAVVGAATVVSLGANMVGRTSVDAGAAKGATPVTMGPLEFTTAQVVVNAGDEAALLVDNQDAFLHDLVIPDQALEVTVNPGSEALLDVSSLAPGTYTFYCSLHSDTSDPDPTTAGMAATLVVE